MTRGKESLVRKARQKRDRRIVALYSRGLTRREVAERLGIHPTTVQRVVAKAGLLRVPGVGGEPPAQPSYEEARERVASVAHLFGTSLHTTAEDLAKKIGVCAATVRRHLTEMGATMRTGGPTRVTAAIAAAIKADLVGNELLSFNDIAKKHGVHKASVNGIAMDRVWKHVPWPRPYVRRPVGLLPEERDGSRGIRGRERPRSRRGRMKRR